MGAEDENTGRYRLAASLARVAVHSGLGWASQMSRSLKETDCAGDDQAEVGLVDVDAGVGTEGDRLVVEPGEHLGPLDLDEEGVPAAGLDRDLARLEDRRLVGARLVVVVLADRKVLRA